MANVIVFTDLDGTLLDTITYSFDQAQEALEVLRELHIPLILTSSKTRAEIELIRHQLGLYHPFISENGGALFVPRNYFHCPHEGVVRYRTYDVLELGTPYGELRTSLRHIERVTGCRLRGFGDMTFDEVAIRTGLSPPLARLAMQREYDEPFVVEGPDVSLDRVARECERLGLQCVRGGRFPHLVKGSDKGRACGHLIQWYRQEYGGERSTLVSIGIGDSVNDLPMLAMVNHPILVQKSDGSHDPKIMLPSLTLSQGIGPVGWNQAVLAVLRGIAAHRTIH